MANANSNTTPIVTKSLAIDGRAALDELGILLSGLNGVVDCLFTLSCRTGTHNLDLCEGSLSATLDLAIRQIAQAQKFVDVAYNAFTQELSEVAA